MAESTEKALQACLDYDRWKRHIEGLTEDIGSVECPRGVEDETGVSCFMAAKDRLEEGVRGLRPDGPYHGEWPTLADISAAVSDCPACSHLCDLIRLRKHARQRWGVAKRAIRTVARNHTDTERGG